MRTCPTNPSSNKGLTNLEVLLLTGVLVIITAWVLLPILRSHRVYRGYCGNNVKQTGLAFKTWALDNHDRFPVQVPVAEGGTMGMTNAGQLFAHFMVMSNELSTPRLLVCPEDRRRKAATNFSLGFADANISYFLNLDGTEARTNTVLSGDANLTNRPLPKLNIVRLGSNQSLGWTKTRHRGCGWLLFVDGHADPFTNGSIPSTVLHDLLVSKDRLLMP